MESLILIFLTSFMVALSGALMPGPMLTMTIADASERGFWVGPLLVLGHGILELVLVFLVLVGLGPFLTRPEVMGAVGLAGGAVLWWLGISMIRDAGKVQPGFEVHGGSSSGSAVMHGVLASVSNPYWSIWWATIGMGYLVAALKFGVAGIVFFFVGHILADLAWYSAISFAVTRGKQFIRPRLYRRVIIFCGLFLILFGLWFFYFGWQSF